MALANYHKKRNFKLTNEPRGSKHKTSKVGQNLSFVIQKHNASHLHYDFRLEMKGTLKSWAIPKGPSLDPSVKRLAVEVEDHPLEYKNFEGVIPERQYGAGVVMIWDYGYWECEGDLDPYQSYKKGGIHIILQGTKLHGAWNLIKIKSGKNSSYSKNSKNNWLLIKADDKYARAEAGYDILKKKPLSAVSKLSTLQIQQKVENSQNQTKVIKNTTERKGNNEGIGKDKGKGKGKGKKKDNKTVSLELKKISHATKKPMPNNISPELCTLANKTPNGDNWIHEVKYDGYRLLCFIKNKKIQFITRNGKDWTEYFSPLMNDIKKLKIKNAVLDGEVVVLDKNGKMSFQALQATLKGKSTSTMQYYVFDIPYCDGYDLSHVPLLERKELLKQLFATTGNKNVIFSDFIYGNGIKALETACKQKLEGLVSKKIDSIYEQRRSQNWVKCKCGKRQEFVIGGYTKPKGSRKGFGALLLGFYNSKNELIYCGKVGTGFSQKLLSEMLKKFSKNVRGTSPFANTDLIEKKSEVTWLKPTFVGEVSFTEFTHDDILRHPSFLGLREDKEAKDVGKEIEHEAISKKTQKKENVANIKAHKKGKPSKHSLKPTSNSEMIAFGTVKISNPKKILYPKPKITKQEIASYYHKISDRILPYITERPLSILRCPDGFGQECFFQKHFLKSFSDSLHPIHIQGDKQDYFYIKDEEGLINLVQLGVLEFHPWGSRIDNVEKPDMIIFDLDPAPNVEWNLIIASALFIKEQLEKLELQSFIKTTGGKGLHIVIPITRKLEWSEVKDFAHKFALKMCELQPEFFICKMTKSERSGKIFIDYLRNGRGATAVAPYSTRARGNASISTPVSWKELKNIKSADQYTLSNIIARLSKIKDPWEGFFTCRQSISKEMFF